tara:strand:- start:425 stop:721 length:297 start_codon:yes stop_codon:yes gene_type:complete
MKRYAKKFLSQDEIDRIISMAWEDRTPFEAILNQFKTNESDVIKLMRYELKPKSFKRWRKRVQNRKTKHKMLSNSTSFRFKSKSQKSITFNKISKKKY